MALGTRRRQRQQDLWVHYSELRRFVGVALDQSAPDHSSLSRTRRLIDLETHRAVFTWVLKVLARHKMLRGTTLAIDATTLEANAALRSIVHRLSGESYRDFLKKLAAESGIETPTREQLAKLDRDRKNKGSNQDWVNPQDRDAKMKDGRTHLAHISEHAVDTETGAIVAVTVQGADQGDTQTLGQTLGEAAAQLAVVPKTRRPTTSWRRVGSRSWWPTRGITASRF